MTNVKSTKYASLLYPSISQLIPAHLWSEKYQYADKVLLADTNCHISFQTYKTSVF